MGGGEMFWKWIEWQIEMSGCQSDEVGLVWSPKDQPELWLFFDFQYKIMGSSLVPKKYLGR